MTADLRAGPWVVGTRVPLVEEGFEQQPLLHADGDLIEWDEPTMSYDRRRTLRQRALNDAGRNPLTREPAHRDAPTTTSPHDRYMRSGTCGGCVWLVHLTIPRVTSSKPPKVELKCGFDGGARVTRGEASTVREWWKACPAYEPNPDLF